MDTINKFTIDRSKWRPGNLCDYDGNKCALGQLCAAAGVPDEALMVARNLPEREWCAEYPLPPWVCDQSQNRLPSGKTMRSAVLQANDEDYTDEYREGLLTTLFRHGGVEVEFVGKYRSPNPRPPLDKP